MPSAGRRDPFVGFNFIVEIDGVTRAGFTAVSGLTSTVDVISYREGAESRVRKLPGLVKYSPLMLKRGLTVDRSLWLWHRAVLNGDVQRRNVSVVLLDAARAPVARWNFLDAWPARWEGPELNAQSSDVLIESLEIVHEGMEWAD
jgi:phage tail-like protein